MDISFINKTRKTPLSKRRVVLWEKIAQSTLPKDYNLSVIFIGDARMRTLNRIYRKKDKPTNVLAFPIAKDSGEIYLDIPYINRESHKYDHAKSVHLEYLFIHGLLHLGGHDHGDAMEREERKLMERFIKQRA